MSEYNELTKWQLCEKVAELEAELARWKAVALDWQERALTSEHKLDALKSRQAM